MRIPVFLSQTGETADGGCRLEIFSALTAKDSSTSVDEETELSKSVGIE